MFAMEFDQQLQEHTPALKSFAYKFTREDSVADDLLQDTLFKAVRYCEKFKEGTNIKAWLFTIMRNTFINDYRKTTRIQKVVTQQEDIASEHLVRSATMNAGEGKLALADIQNALSRLPKNYYDPFMQYFEGYKYEEIAEHLQIPIGTVKTRIHMARHMLKKMLKPYANNR